MRLRLDSIVKQIGAAPDLHPIDLSFEPGSVNVLLGATLAGKTSLLRIIAGLDAPTSGRMFVDDRDVTGVSVRERDVAMVYQQFVNYPSLSVYENIASPLRLQRRRPEAIRERVGSIAELLKLTPYLDRVPSQLSGGQQQRVALARALAKDAALLLLDEPFVNLDYKLREELRAELPSLLRNGHTTLVYTTTEPREALQLGGNTAILDAGRLLQFGPALDTYLCPASLSTARVFSDPPLNVFERAELAARHDSPPAVEMLGIHAHRLRIAPRSERDIAFDGRVSLAEISGSETFLHVTRTRHALVAQLAGVHDLAIDSLCTLFVDPADLYGFDRAGKTIVVPARTGSA